MLNPYSMNAVAVSSVVKAIVALVVVVMTEGVVMDGGLVSSTACVIADSGLDCALSLPAPSYADTV